MSKPLRPKRGTTAENDAFTGLAYEVTLDTEKHRLRTHDGVTAGGYEHALVRDLPSAMSGATSSAAGQAGLVPAPAKGYQSRPLRGDGTWATSLACNITGLAAKATADAGGNTITTTYATKSEVSAQKTALEAEIEAAAVQPSGTTPKAPGTASAGTETAYARGDHVHPAQTTVNYAESAGAASQAHIMLNCYAAMGRTVTLPGGGTWAYFRTSPSSYNYYEDLAAGTAAGGTSFSFSGGQGGILAVRIA